MTYNENRCVLREILWELSSKYFRVPYCLLYSNCPSYHKVQRHKVNLPAVILEKMIASKDLQESLPYGSLLTLIFKKFSVDLSGEMFVGNKEKIGIFTLKRSKYSLVGKKQNLWYKSSVPECEHEIFPDESLVSLLSNEAPASEVQHEPPSIQIRSEDSFPVQEDVPPSIPVLDAPEDTINDVLRDLRGKKVISEDIPTSSPHDHLFEEREPHHSPSQFETRPRSQGESSNSLNDILDLVRSQHENMSVLHMQVVLLDAKFDGLSDEVKQIEDLLLQLVCQPGTSRPSGPASSQQQEETVPTQEQEHQAESHDPVPEDPVLEQSVEKEPENLIVQQPMSVEFQQQKDE
ncbi:hypothetical protein Taro_014189 [Colocasia esculenta]|uniref:Uncharacterized protein n=1 Tax=Colocasia esculenta TaxID=4460 RepID=A0A843UPE5_COLES|nr:hypothetical protein [Colocasia esculenta]